MSPAPRPRPVGLGTDAPAAPPVDVSVLVPISERLEPLVELYDEFAAPLRERGVRFEFLFLAEPWARREVDRLRPLIEAGEPIRLLELGQSVGETALLKLGAENARGETLITLPAYRRIEAATLPTLLDTLDGQVDIVVARRWPRLDSSLNKLQNRVLHGLIAGLSGNRIHDVACGVRVLRRAALRELPLYGDLHRFLPLFALREGYRVVEVSAPQHPGDRSPLIYSPAIYLRRLVDILGLLFLLRFTDKPLRFFGMFGSTLAGIGGVLLAGLLVQRLGGAPIAERPLLLLGVLLVVLGFQAIALGLIGEIVVHLHAPHRRPYRLERRTAPVAALQEADDGPREADDQPPRSASGG